MKWYFICSAAFVTVSKSILYNYAILEQAALTSRQATKICENCKPEVGYIYQGPLLQTGFNFNPSMDK